ncbi:hypothetical protein G7Y89_g3233 [Cudoniella acicularis]|uniref:DUF8035 domain-containing protein n=1 Tax=Cudoniella acicularis TaxID=354080 RepID=A0A8H4W7V0_9HELO|nr:hypothetical protein G7Y89_g3233 [Cudoniella acicularis]
MSRRGETVYEERDYYAREGPPPVRTRERERDYEEVDIYSRRERDGNRPEFLREDYGRTGPGELVLRERETETFSRPIERRPRSPSPVRIRERERIVRRSPTPPPVERVRTRVVERERERSPTPPPERLRARVIETRERIRERSPSPVRIRERIIERQRSPSPPVRIRERIVERERERSPSPPRVETVRIRNIERETRQPSPSPSPSPSPPPSIRAPPIHQEIITHHRHIDHGFERAHVPTPPPPPRRTKETKETDIDIYTSRNGTEVDITKTSRSKTPQPASISRRDNFYDDSVLFDQERDKLRVRDTRLDINRRRSLSARPDTRDRMKIDIRERETFRDDVRDDIRDDDEAEYYRRKVDERAYIGEAYNGATKDWAIVDVPPGTERVRMDGVGGASQEVTWQRYNGVRRSRFIPERERPERPERVERVEFREEKIKEEPRRESSGMEIEISTSSRRREGGGGSYEREYERIEETSDRRVGLPRAPPKQRVGDLWTEITKDLVVREAIIELGYDFEETEYFYYIIQYLRYEDVLELVKLSEQIRRERQHHIAEVERERERFERREREREEWERSARRRDRKRDSETVYDDERIVEREVIYDGPGRRGPRSRGGGW